MVILRCEKINATVIVGHSFIESDSLKSIANLKACKEHLYRIFMHREKIPSTWDIFKKLLRKIFSYFHKTYFGINV